MPDLPDSSSTPQDESARRALWASEVRARLSSLRLTPTREADIIEELAQHLEDRWRELMSGGASPEDATRGTLAEFRGRDVLARYMAPLRQSNAPRAITPGVPLPASQSQSHSDSHSHSRARLRGVIVGVWQDVRYAARMMRKQPAFTAIATLTLALGIGANVAIFSVVYGVLLKPLPLPDPGTLVSVWHRAPGLNVGRLEQGDATYFTYRDSNRAFEDIGLWNSEEVSVTGHGEPERVKALRVTDGVLSILRISPLRGRIFTRDDDASGSPRRAILTYAYWQRRFGGAEDAIGRSLDIGGRPHEIVGVLPASFDFLQTDPAVLVTFRFNRAQTRVGDFSYRGIARLKPGVTLQEANADVERMIPLTFDRFPLWPGMTRKMFEESRMGPDVHPLSDDMIGDAGRVLWILAGTVGIVLLIACANVANLFLVRAEGRQQEIAVRLALGASSGRVARELLCESVGLALLGGAFGLVLAWAGIRLLAALAPAGLPRINQIGIDPVVLAFTVVVSLLTGLLFGLIPVMRCGAGTMRLTDGRRSATDTPGRHRVRNALVVAEIALALVLLIVSGLMIRTFIALRHVEPGYTRPAEVQTFRVSIPAALIGDPQQTVIAFQQIAQQLQQVPGVASVGLSTSVTMDGNRASVAIFVEDFPDAGRAMPPVRRHKRVAPGYFETMGNPVIAGRSMTWEDVSRGTSVIVTENFARQYWKAPADAIGKRVRQSDLNPWREIIGVVGNEHDDGLNQPATAIVYWPMLIKQWWVDAIDVQRTMTFVVRSRRVGSPGFLRELQQAVWAVNPNLPLASVRTLDDIQAKSMAQTSFALVMLAIAATVALLLGSVGIYGVVAYVAAQRTREIGIRMALGARIGDVRRMFLRHGLRLTMTGIAIGIVVALVLTRIMSALLFGVSAIDPITYGVVSCALAAIGLLATYLPARRASRVDPILALRADT